MSLKKYMWPIIGFAAMFFSIHMLYQEFVSPHGAMSNFSWADFLHRLQSLSISQWILAGFFSILAYLALAGYDRIALQYLHKKISWFFITLCSFTTYALSHNLGASMFSGAAIRYRAYSLKGMTGSEVAVLVGFCSFTFALGTILLSGIVLLLRPDLLNIFIPYCKNIFGYNFQPYHIKIFSYALGIIFLTLIFFYVLGSFYKRKPFKLGKYLCIHYPPFYIVLQQLLIGPLELLGAAGIIHSALPAMYHVSFLLVLGAFLASFTLGILSNAPAGGLGVLEVIFISFIPGVDARDLLVALVIFRLLYLVIPFIISLIIVGIFEVKQYLHHRSSAEG